MNKKTLEEAVKQAELFLKQAEIIQEHKTAAGYFFAGCRETATLRRRSMDLTNSLADLRRHD